MTLRRKTLLATAAALVGLVAVVYAAAQLIVLSSYADLEEQRTRQNVQRALNALSVELSALSQVAIDWAEWDDTYAFIEDGNSEYVETNIIERTFTQLRLNLMLFVHSDGHIVFGGAFDLATQQRLPVPASLEQLLPPDSILLRHPDTETGQKGVILLPEGPMLVASRPILTSEGKGPARGSLILGRYLDSPLIKHLGETTQLSVTVRPADDAAMPPDFLAARSALSGDEPIAVRPLSQESMGGYTLVTDVYGKPALLLRVDGPRSIYQRGQESLRLLIASLLAAGLLFGTVTLLTQERLVLSRLARLSSQLREIGMSGDPSTRVTTGGADELSSLAAATNRMLESLMLSQERLSESKRQVLGVLELLESITDPFIAMDADHRLTYINRKAEALLLGSREEVLGRSVWERLPQPVGPTLARECDRAMTEGTAVQLELFHPAHGAWYEAHIYPFSGGLSIYLREITKRKQAEHSLKKTTETLQALVEASPLAIVALDLEGKVELWNPAAERILGWRREEVLGRAIPINPVDMEPISEAARSQLREGGAQFGVEIQPRRKDGTIVEMLMSTARLLDAQGEARGTMAVLTDLTEHKELQRQLLRAQRLETAGRIAGQVAHDFNNLLGPLVAYPELIKMKLPPGHAALAFCDAMMEAAQRIAEINTDMLALSRRALLHEQPIDLNRLVRQAVAQLEDKPDTLAVQTDLEPDLLAASGSPAQLLRVLSNLIGNAREAMVDVGLLGTRTSNVYVDRPFGCYNRVEIGEYVRLDVSDTGCGIEPEIKDKIFDAFFTTKPSDRRRGSGLGLSVVQAIVDDHRGYIDLESKPGVGSTFSVFLPAHREPAGKTPTEGLPAGTEAILVVDDDQAQRDVVAQLLHALGYQVDVAAGGEEAVAFLREHDADLVILDMIMPPGIDGAETYRRMLELRSGQRAIILSGFAETERVRDARALGVAAYLRKPVTLDKLARTVRHALDLGGLSARSGSTSPPPAPSQSAS